MLKRIVVAFLLAVALVVVLPAPVVEAQICPPWGCGDPQCEPIVRCIYVPIWDRWVCWLEYPC